MATQGKGNNFVQIESKKKNKIIRVSFLKITKDLPKREKKSVQEKKIND